MIEEIRNRPSFANIRIQLEPGESIIAEADAMASMSPNIEMRTKVNGGFMGGMARKFLGGESFFVNEFSSPSGQGEVILTQAFPGDMQAIELRGNSLYLQPGAYIASEPTVQLGTGYAGFGSFIAGQGLFRLHVSGHGKVFIGAYGSIFVREIDQEYVVDSGHLVAYEPTVGIRAGLAGGIFSSFFSGEGIVTRLTGPGRVYMQSRAVAGLVSWTNSHI